MNMPAQRRSTLFLLTVLASATLLAAAAENLSEPAGSWRFGATIYAYLPSIGGTTTFPDGGSGSGIDADTILDNLEMTFMGSFDAHNGRWGMFTDVLYLDLAADKARNSIQGNPVDLSLGFSGWIWTLAGEYRLAASPTLTLDALAGARYYDVETEMGLDFAQDALPSFEANASDSVWDGIVGVKGRFAFGDRQQWLLPFYADVGAGESDLTWQVAAGVGHAFNWGEINALWRYIGYEFDSGSRVQDVNFNGPMIGATFRW